MFHNKKMSWHVTSRRNRNTPQEIQERNWILFQMAWGVTYRVGCATNVCGGRYFAVCHYSPRYVLLIYAFRRITELWIPPKNRYLQWKQVRPSCVPTGKSVQGQRWLWRRTDVLGRGRTLCGHPRRTPRSTVTPRTHPVYCNAQPDSVAGATNGWIQCV